MSNPMIPPSAEYKKRVEAGAAPPRGVFEVPPDWGNRLKDFNGLPMSVAVWGATNAVGRETVIIPHALTTSKPIIDRANAGNESKNFATADTSKLAVHHWSAPGLKVMDDMWHALSPHGRELVKESIETACFVSAGAQYTLGRIAAAVPRKGANVSHIRPPTAGEARQACRDMGIDVAKLRKLGLKPLNFPPEEGDVQVMRGNPKASQGYPVLGTLEEPETARRVEGLVITLNRELEGLPDKSRAGVARWYQDKINNAPYLLVQRGQAKNEVTTRDKVVAGKLRFYAIGNGHMNVIAKQALDVVKAHTTNFLTDPGCSCFLGCNFGRGGAARFVEEVDRRLAEENFVYSAVGDDNIIFVRLFDGRLLVFDLDMRSYDLTFLGAVKAPLVYAYTEAVAVVRPLSAYVLGNMLMTRLTAVSHGLMKLLSDGNPSGTPGVSDINGMGTSVVMQRLKPVLLAMRGEVTEARVRGAVKRVAATLGFDATIQQVHFVAAPQAPTPVRTWMSDEGGSFEYLAFTLHGERAYVAATYNIQRLFARMPYPSRPGIKKPEFLPAEAARLLSVALSTGLPDDVFTEEVQEALFRGSVLLALDVLEKQVTLSKPYEVGHGPDVLAYAATVADTSLTGLLRAAVQGPLPLWTAASEPLTERPFTIFHTNAEWSRAAAFIPDLLELGVPPPEGTAVPVPAASLAAARVSQRVWSASEEKTREEEVFSRLQHMGDHEEDDRPVTDWATFMEDEDEKDAEAARESKALAAQLPYVGNPFADDAPWYSTGAPLEPTLPARPRYPLAHPPTDANAGRPPPTARWAPDLPKRERAHESGPRLSKDERKYASQLASQLEDADLDEPDYEGSEPDDAGLTARDEDDLIEAELASRRSYVRGHNPFDDFGPSTGAFSS